MCACVRPAAKRAASSVAPLENRLGQSLIRPSSSAAHAVGAGLVGGTRRFARSAVVLVGRRVDLAAVARRAVAVAKALVAAPDRAAARAAGGLGIVEDRKSTRLNSSHSQISYAVFCLKKKK